MPNAARILSLLLLAAGCATPRVEIFSADGDRRMSYRDEGYSGNKLLTTTPRGGNLFRISHERPDAPEFRLSERSPEGEVLRRVPVPRYHPSPDDDFVAVRPDGNALAYRRDGDLYTYDLDTRQASLVLEGIDDSEPFGPGLAWIDAVQLLAFLGSGPNRPIGRILRIDTVSRQITASFELYQMSGFALSPSGRLLAVTQWARGAGIHIIDVATLSVVREISGHSLRSWTKLPAWNPSESKVAYLDGSLLSVLTLGERSPRRVALTPDGQACYFVAFPSDELLVYRCRATWKRDSDQLFFLDLASERVVKTLAAEQIDPCIAIAGGTMVACRVSGPTEAR